jgi:hypothetical protein
MAESQHSLVVPAIRSSQLGVRRRFQFGIRHLFTATLGVAICAWTIKSCLALYDNYGLTGSILLGLGGFLFVLTLPLFFIPFPGTRRSWLVAWTIILVLFCTRQTMLGHRLAAIEEEVARIADFARAKREASGEYPKDLCEFRYSIPRLKQFVEYERWSPDGYQIRYQPTDRDWWGVYHVYNSDGIKYFEDD